MVVTTVGVFGVIEACGLADVRSPGFLERCMGRLGRLRAAGDIWPPGVTMGPEAIETGEDRTRG
jgi:hypothetical protein